MQGWSIPGQVIASFLQLDDGVAAVAALPAFAAGLLKELVRLGVAGTGLGVVPAVVAGTAHLGLAAPALAMMEALVAADVLGPDPLAAMARWTVQTVPCRVFGEFAVPLALELVVKEALDVLERDVVGSATPWRHVLGIRKGQPKVAPQAAVTHGVATLEPYGLLRRHVIVQTDDARKSGPAATVRAVLRGGTESGGDKPCCGPVWRLRLERETEAVVICGAPG